LKTILPNSSPDNISVIIVNYNTSDLLVRCLDSIALCGNDLPEVIVVDNASQDANLQSIQERFPWVKLISNDKNYGFGRANNQALKICNRPYVYFLNPDTEVKPEAFTAMLDFMESHPEVGLAGTKLVYPDGSYQPSVERSYPGARYAKKQLEGLKGDIAWVLGASMISRRDVMLALKGFDENFFLYGEDLDLCLRVRKAGWAIGYVPNAVVVHWEGKSERNNLPIRVWEKKTRGEITFFKKYYTQQSFRIIRRNNIVKAIWRIITLKISLPFARDKATVFNKLDKYRAALRIFYNSKANGLRRASSN
jgi:GT2 family glycosyltransferase